MTSSWTSAPAFLWLETTYGGPGWKHDTYNLENHYATWCTKLYDRCLNLYDSFASRQLCANIFVSYNFQLPKLAYKNPHFWSPCEPRVRRPGVRCSRRPLNVCRVSRGATAPGDGQGDRWRCHTGPGLKMQRGVPFLCSGGAAGPRARRFCSGRGSDPKPRGKGGR